jgi:hypothetical protein
VVDHGWRQPKGSPEYGLAATSVGESLPQVGEKKEGSTGILTGGNFGRRGPGFDVASMMHTGGWHSPLRMMHERRGDERRKGYGTVECGEGVGAFYRAGGERAEVVGAGARPTAINGAICEGGNGEGK